MTKDKLAPLPQLMGAQLQAAGPGEQIWLSASAGTGKTQVLSARVLRLLLSGVDPEAILCLTFTKAGAAEMAGRIHDRLGAWVTMSGTELAKDLKALGEDFAPDARDVPRRLFARVLDARGSGLRVQTIHSFCQTLLATFPQEAGLSPGFRPVEGREEDQLVSSALAEMVDSALRGGEVHLLDRLRRLSFKLGDGAILPLLKRCAAAPDAMDALGGNIPILVDKWLTGFADPQTRVLEDCSDEKIDRNALESLLEANRGWFTQKGTRNAESEKAEKRLATWLMLPPEGRAKCLPELVLSWRKADGDRRSKLPPLDGVERMLDQLDVYFEPMLELAAAIAIAGPITDALTLGQAYARTYAQAKLDAGVVDFGDLIRSTRKLLEQPGIGDWIKFKIDQSVDHILVDEAQDTNESQWAIVKALAEDFFSGEGAKGGKRRTLFTVGDFKQAIFGFQGTDPREFKKAGDYFAERISGVDQELAMLSLSQSFRSAQSILDLTDLVVGDLGHEALGLAEAPPPHKSATKGQSAQIHILPPVRNKPDEMAVDADEDDPENWLTEAELRWANDLAKQVRDWTTGGLYLRNKDRAAQPGDVMILLQKRGDLARLIVSRLYEAGVPVAGVDRLRLNAPIAVQDLLAAIRFVLQPEDDLTLACLLVSPLIGWDQEALYEHAKGRKGTSLWAHLGDAKPAALKALLGTADLNTPYRFLEGLLSGPIDGRRKLIARLGEEARDPIEALLNAALEFEQQAVPSLQQFVDWFDRGDVDIKRDPSKPENAVRIMTAHGSKGLQAPIVVLADATMDPDFSKPDALDWAVEDGLTLPLFHPKKAEMVGSLALSAAEMAKRERQEHWRLLYVAMTRAEEVLVAGGALKPKQEKDGPSDQCWHTRLSAAIAHMDGVGEGGQSFIREAPVMAEKAEARNSIAAWLEVPEWAQLPAPEEARPPRPLAPSALEESDTEPNPPPDPARTVAAERGIMLHSLFERLPGVVVADRATAADRWLEQSCGIADATVRAELVATALSVLATPEFAELFGPDSLAEVPLSGVVAGRVIAGAVDRLLVRADDVLVVDYKTGRRIPGSVDAIPRHHKAQMAAYVAVLQGIFPGKTVRAALLYSSGPALLELPVDVLAAFKPGFTDAQDK